MHEVADGIYAPEECSHERDEEKETPAGAEAVCAEEDVAKCKRICRGVLLNRRESFVIRGPVFFGVKVQGSSSCDIRYTREMA
jgi:hypothetical protein